MDRHLAYHPAHHSYSRHFLLGDICPPAPSGALAFTSTLAPFLSINPATTATTAITPAITSTR